MPTADQPSTVSVNDVRQLILVHAAGAAYVRKYQLTGDHDADRYLTGYLAGVESVIEGLTALTDGRES